MGRYRESAITCHSCGGRDISVFYECRDVPAQSCTLVASPQAARDYPRGSIDLGLCHSCGFIQNCSFDPARIDYRQAAEETQAFSTTFSVFAEQLARSLIDRHDLFGKDVLEIGCGKGDFLYLLAALGDNSGIGIDPGYVARRHEGAGAARLEFIADYFSDVHIGLPADLVCCRHVLEHVQAVRDFMWLIRQAADVSPCTAVFLEVPDTRRVLTEGAFWDIYHEHCSYFTPGSLARLVRASGFATLHLSLGYHEQYILLEAGAETGNTPAGPVNNEPTVGRRVTEDTVAQVEKDVEHFMALVATKRSYWREKLAGLLTGGRRTVLWGGGSKAVAFLTTLGIQDEVSCVVDINPHKQGFFLPGTGHDVVAPEHLLTEEPDVVVVMNPVYRGEVQDWLATRGLMCEVLTL